MGVTGTHVAVLTPVAGVGAAHAGHAPGGGEAWEVRGPGLPSYHSPPGPMGRREGRGHEGPPEAHRTQHGMKRWGDRDQKGQDSRLECAAVIEDEVDPGELDPRLPGQQLQPHGAGGPCSEPRGGREQARDAECPQPREPQPTDHAPG